MKWWQELTAGVIALPIMIILIAIGPFGWMLMFALMGLSNMLNPDGPNF